jgi:hypothetical protein
MPTEALPFFPDQKSGSEQLAGASPIAMNVVFDAAGAVRRRPGLVTYDGAPETVIDSNGIDGLKRTENGNLYASSAGELYRVTAGGRVRLTVNRNIPGGRRPTFAETEMLLVVAAGNRIIKFALDGSFPPALLGGDPPLASHVLAHGQRLLANDVDLDRTKMRYSSTASGTTSYAGNEIWLPGDEGTAGFFSAEARPDPIVASHENTNEVFVWGPGTVQVYSPDTFLVYAPNQALEHGCSAPYSIVKRDQEFFWLDDRRRFIRSNGRTSQVISAGIQPTLSEMRFTTDCIGYNVHLGALDCIVWSFPTDGRTFVYAVGGGWSQWSAWDDPTNSWAPLPVSAHTIIPGTGANVVGLTDGRIAAFSRMATSDLGSRLNAHVTTGFLNRGKAQRKRCQSVSLTIKAGVTNETARGWLSWRDDEGAWGPPLEVSLTAGQTVSPDVQFFSLGTYRTRQWRFEFDADTDVVLASALETFEVLDA